MSDYPYVLVYRGIQKPLEFMGLRGRYVYIGAGIAVVAILLFIVGFILVGLLFSFILVLLLLSTATAWILVKQKKGLHTKKVLEGTYIANTLFEIK